MQTHLPARSHRGLCNQQTGGALLRLYSGYGASGKVLYTLRPVDGGHGTAAG